MDRRRAAGSLLALAACLAYATAAPTASNHTTLDLYDGAPEGCYYNFQHYGEGDRIMTNEPCLNCTCHNRMLMCYLRVCPFTKPIGQDCTIEKRADQCCPIVTCPDVPVDLLTSTTTSPAEYGATGLGKLDKFGCSINGKYFPEGSKVPPTPNKPCEHCYCIRNMTTCVMQECTLHVDGCTPIYHKDVCCPVRYSCDHPEDEILMLDDMSTTVRPTPGFLLTTTQMPPVTQMSQDCVYDSKIFPDGALIKTEKACDHCYCMKGDIVCVVQECGTPMENEGKNCTALSPREGVCCPDTYICEGDEPITGTYEDSEPTTELRLETLTTLTPPRRAGSEASGYRHEDKAPTEAPIMEPEVEGSGEDQGSTDSDLNSKYRPSYETEEPHEYITVPAVKETSVVMTEVTTGIYKEPEILQSTTQKLQEPELGSGEEDSSVTDISPATSALPTYEQDVTTAKHEHDIIETEQTEKPESQVKISTTTVSDIKDDQDLDTEDKLSTPKLEQDIKSETEALTTQAIPTLEEGESKTTESTNVDESKPEKPVTVQELSPSTTSAPGIEEEISTESPETVTEHREDLEPHPHYGITASTPMLEEIEKETTVFNERDQSSSEKIMPSTTLSSITSVEKIEKHETEPEKPVDEIPSEYITTVASLFESDEITTEETESPQYLPTTTISISDDREKKTTLSDLPTEDTVGGKTEQSEFSSTSAPIEKHDDITTDEPDKGLNTIPSDGVEEHTSESTTTGKITPSEEQESTQQIIPVEDKYKPDIEYSTFAPKLSTVASSESTTEISYTTIPIEKEIDSQDVSETTTTSADIINKITEASTQEQEKESVTTISADQKPVTAEAEKQTPQAEEITDRPIYETTSLPDKDETPEKYSTITIASPYDKMPETTIANLEENEIFNEPRIPGEGDCLINGITYRNETDVPITFKCQSNCKCISSIVKCDPIICSPPPEYMDNCRTMYDSLDPCCPTYVCDHKSETMPPQSHSQMAGTDAPTITPIECNGDECVVTDTKPPVDSSAPCTSDSCQSDDKQGSDIFGSSTEKICTDDSCQATPVKPCAGDECKISPETQPELPCAGNDCNTLTQDSETQKPKESCEGGRCKDTQVPCTDNDCKVSETQTPKETCVGGECKESLIPCAGTDCNIPTQDTETQKPKDMLCKGNECKDSQEPTGEPCVGETCRRKESSVSDQPPSGCLGTECQQSEIAPHDLTTAFLSEHTTPQITSHDITTEKTEIESSSDESDTKISEQEDITKSPEILEEHTTAAYNDDDTNASTTSKLDAAEETLLQTTASVIKPDDIISGPSKTHELEPHGASTPSHISDGEEVTRTPVEDKTLPLETYETTPEPITKSTEEDLIEKTTSKITQQTETQPKLDELPTPETIEKDETVTKSPEETYTEPSKMFDAKQETVEKESTKPYPDTSVHNVGDVEITKVTDVEGTQPTESYNMSEKTTPSSETAYLTTRKSEESTTFAPKASDELPVEGTHASEVGVSDELTTKAGEEGETTASKPTQDEVEDVTSHKLQTDGDVIETTTLRKESSTPKTYDINEPVQTTSVPEVGENLDSTIGEDMDEKKVTAITASEMEFGTEPQKGTTVQEAAEIPDTTTKATERETTESSEYDMKPEKVHGDSQPQTDDIPEISTEFSKAPEIESEVTTPKLKESTESVTTATEKTMTEQGEIIENEPEKATQEMDQKLTTQAPEIDEESSQASDVEQPKATTLQIIEEATSESTTHLEFDKDKETKGTEEKETEPTRTYDIESDVTSKPSDVSMDKESVTISPEKDQTESSVTELSATTAIKTDEKDETLTDDSYIEPSKTDIESQKGTVPTIITEKEDREPTDTNVQETTPLYESFDLTTTSSEKTSTVSPKETDTESQYVTTPKTIKEKETHSPKDTERTTTEVYSVEPEMTDSPKPSIQSYESITKSPSDENDELTPPSEIQDQKPESTPKIPELENTAEMSEPGSTPEIDETMVTQTPDKTDTEPSKVYKDKVTTSLPAADTEHKEEEQEPSEPNKTDVTEPQETTTTEEERLELTTKPTSFETSESGETSDIESEKATIPSETTEKFVDVTKGPGVEDAVTSQIYEKPDGTSSEKMPETATKAVEAAETVSPKVSDTEPQQGGTESDLDLREGDGVTSLDQEVTVSPVKTHEMEPEQEKVSYPQITTKSIEEITTQPSKIFETETQEPVTFAEVDEEKEEESSTKTPSETQDQKPTKSSEIEPEKATLPPKESESEKDQEKEKDESFITTEREPIKEIQPDTEKPAEYTTEPQMTKSPIEPTQPDTQDLKTELPQVTVSEPIETSTKPKDSDENPTEEPEKYVPQESDTTSQPSSDVSPVELQQETDADTPEDKITTSSPAIFETVTEPEEMTTKSPEISSSEKTPSTSAPYVPEEITTTSELLQDVVTHMPDITKVTSEEEGIKSDQEKMSTVGVKEPTTKQETTEAPVERETTPYQTKVEATTTLASYDVTQEQAEPELPLEKEPEIIESSTLRQKPSIIPDYDHQSTLSVGVDVPEKTTEPVPLEEASSSPDLHVEPTMVPETIAGADYTTVKSVSEEVIPVQTEKSPAPDEKPPQVTSQDAEVNEDEILATTKATPMKPEEVPTTAPAVDVTIKPEDKLTEAPATPAPQQPKPIPTEGQPADELPTPDEETQFPSGGGTGYGQEPDYMEEDQTFGPGTCRYGGKVYVSAQQIPRDDPCDFCFCFRSDIICLQQSCPPPIHGCHEEPIQGFCCPRYECPVSMATTVNVTTTTTTTTTTLPPHFPVHSYKGSAQRKGCLIKGQTYKVGDVVRSSSGPCLHCTCGGDGQMKCDPKACTPEPMLRQMIAAAVSAKRRR